MEALLVLTILVACITLSVEAWTSEDRETFRQWRKEFDKVYRSQAEEREAMGNFLRNRDDIEAHNKLYNQGKFSYEKGLNEHSDLSPQQMRKHLLGIKFPRGSGNRRSKRAIAGFGSTTSIPNYPPGPHSIDWNDLGLVGPVVNQGKTYLSLTNVRLFNCL